MVLLYNLSESYNNLIVALKSQAKIDFNIELVTIKFLHEKLRKKENEGSTNGGSALVACMSKLTTNNLSIKEKVTSKKNKKKDLYNYCKKPRHWTKGYKKKLAN